LFVTAVQSSTTGVSVSPAGPRAVEAAFAPAGGVAEAEAFVRRLAYGHYENFSVVSRLVPRGLRQDFCNVYAFCRTADDLGDEVGDRDAALRHLGRFRQELEACYAGRPAGAVFTALRGTVERHAIPIDPFLDLISAFEQDQRVDRYDTFAQLQDYCRRSANPVGRLVLYVCGYRDEIRQRLSDHTCTALQLTNFWQDVRRDLEGLNRIYLPRETMDRFGVTESQLRRGEADAKFRDMLRFEVDRADELFARGDALLPTLSRPVAAHVALFGQGGRAILDAIRAQGYDTLSRRPTLSKRRKARLVARALGARAMTALFGTGRVA
jgi:squalene synthase HpnC